ncbi:ricin-type beta-trefoil lectin domain protein [Streptomyces lycii]|uniref:Ricin-type beta-trefoil lectin domain protein n=1 Tax=Streptomyces lycii TaxID=2654337 RepID=A0ABQ7FBS3_9ACTN|nr:ricin-type beta-trefoil lectin domain protein [Streptomyces lycii]
MRLRLRNTGDVVDEYRVVPVGDPALWVRVEPASVKLYPGSTGTVELQFAPPRSPDATAGPNPFGVQTVPTERPEAAVVVEGNLTVTPFTEMRAELVPPVVKGRFRGRPVLAVDNLGNVKLTASVTGVESSDQLGFDIHPSNVQIEPGRAAFVRSTVRPQAVTWFGRKETRPFQLAVQRSGTEPLPVDGTYVQRSVLPHWILATFSILLALAIVFVILWFTRAPTVQSLATEKAANPSASALPSPTETESKSPSASSSPSSSPAKEEKEEEKPPGGGGGGDKKPEADEQEAPARKGPTNVGTLVNRKSNKCLSSQTGEDGTQLVIEACKSKDAGQKWTVNRDGSVVSQKRCMDVAWGSHDNLTKIQVANCSDHVAQDFDFNGQGEIVAVDSGKCLDVLNGGTADGTPVVLFVCGNGQGNQTFDFSGVLPDGA